MLQRTIRRHIGIANQLGDLPFDVVYRRLAPSFSSCSGSLGDMGSAHWNKRRSKALLRLAKWTRRSSSLHFIILFSLFVPFCDCYTRIMNAHNKIQFSYARIKCALKDSSCDSPISKNFMLTILVSNASSSSTIVFKCPHRKDDCIFTQWFTV
ncbi:hypothetical protein H5410_003701 [Solanum commersonii]|uniref:Uncharacterized protein n=1 Tax=Solanum commersonii TaxID=4109 RepID=A0A9J6B5R2_SOLCO|nr:hypothetical protein H5410_003701 [Solanum commersonii]